MCSPRLRSTTPEWLSADAAPARISPPASACRRDTAGTLTLESMRSPGPSSPSPCSRVCSVQPCRTDALAHAAGIVYPCAAGRADPPARARRASRRSHPGLAGSPRRGRACRCRPHRKPRHHGHLGRRRARGVAVAVRRIVADRRAERARRGDLRLVLDEVRRVRVDRRLEAHRDAAVDRDAPASRAVRPIPEPERDGPRRGSYCPRSSPGASVWGPAFGPSTIDSEPGTNVTPAGSASVSTAPTASSLPVFVAVMRYSMASPR